MPTLLSNRKEVQDSYIRLCRDSRFRLSATDAAIFVGKVLDISPVEVWAHLGMDNMERIAAGTHPCLSAGK